jgi:hypothetical protein
MHRGMGCCIVCPESNVVGININLGLSGNSDRQEQSRSPPKTFIKCLAADHSKTKFHLPILSPDYVGNSTTRMIQILAGYKCKIALAKKIGHRDKELRKKEARLRRNYVQSVREKCVSEVTKTENMVFVQ